MLLIHNFYPTVLLYQCPFKNSHVHPSDSLQVLQSSNKLLYPFFFWCRNLSNGKSLRVRDLWERSLWAGLCSYSRLSQTLVCEGRLEAVAPEGCCCARRLLVAPEGCCAARRLLLCALGRPNRLGSVRLTVSDRCVCGFVLPGTRTHVVLVYDKSGAGDYCEPCLTGGLSDLSQI